ncbi:hypothetical protein [Plantactinospora sp. DSM 117369]
MAPTSTPLRKWGSLTIGLFDAADPRRGHETILEIIALGERPGFDSARVRHRRLQYGIAHGDYVQILTDMATRLGPALGWRPTTTADQPAEQA